MEKDTRPWWKKDSPELQKMKHWLGVLYALVALCIVVTVFVGGPLLFIIITAALAHTYKLIVEYIEEKIENEP